MPKVKVIIGLPGAGKTTFAATLPPSFLRVDSVLKDFPARRKIFDDWVAKGHDVAVIDVKFCDASTLRKFVGRAVVKAAARGQSIDWDFVYFENNPGACAHNCTFRFRPGLARELELIAELSPNYKPTPGPFAPLAVFFANAQESKTVAPDL